MIHISAEAIINRRGMEERVDIVIAGPGTDGEVSAIRRQVGFGFVRPDRVEAFADDIVSNHIPKPASGRGIGGIYVRTRAVIGQAIDGRAIGEMLEPAVL